MYHRIITFHFNHFCNINCQVYLLEFIVIFLSHDVKEFIRFKLSLLILTITLNITKEICYVYK